MAEIVDDNFVCECCMSVMANGDDSSCRDYWNHTHGECELGSEWVLNTTYNEYGEIDAPVWSIPRDCFGCGQACGAFANFYPVVKF